MITAKTSSVQMLQEVQPTRLLGSLMSGVSADGIGWILLAFFSEDKHITLEEENDRIMLTFHREPARILIGTLHVLLAANRHMRGEHAAPRANARDNVITVDGTPGTRGRVGTVRCSWPVQADGVERTLVDDQINLRFREDLAAELAAEIARELGRVAAGGV
jgi:hypothetical protein